MTPIYLSAAILLLANAGVGAWRIWHGPTSADRMVAAELITTTTVAVLLVLSALVEQPVLIDVALLFALLAAVAMANFVTRTWTLLREDSQARDEAGHD
ncbi:MAG: multiple resistance and pH regulation protein F [Halomonas sp.]|nr:monovalent cation/H+ antiporter complex subunit F [Halomonas sp.]MCC5882608.1 multiple resistance and pH regulation protein F [Halomonas sp.]